MKNLIRVLVTVFLITMPLARGAESDVTGLLAQLQSDDTDTRYEDIDYDDKRILWNPERNRFTALP